MINWFDMPAEGLSNGGLFEVKELEVTENGTYETKGEMYNKVTVNVEGGGGSSDFSTAEVTLDNTYGTDTLYFGYPILVNDEWEFRSEAEAGETATVMIPLYKGKSMPINPIQGYMFTGSYIYDSEDDCYYITGDCTISLIVYNITVNSVPIPEGTLGFSPMISDVFDYRPIINGEPSTEDDIQIDLTNGVTNYQVQIAVIKPRSEVSYEAYMNESEGMNPITTGAIQFVDDDGWYFNITGDGTISLASA